MLLALLLLPAQDDKLLKDNFKEKIKNLIKDVECIHVVKPGMYTSNGLENVDFDKIKFMTIFADYTHVLMKSGKVSK